MKYFYAFLILISTFCARAVSPSFQSFNTNQFIVNQPANDISIRNNSNTVPVGIYPIKIANLTGSNYWSIDGSGITNGYVLTVSNGIATWQTNSGSGGGSGGISALTGDVTASGSGSVVATVKGANGQLYSSLITGILKNTTGTGVPSIAVATDFPTLNQNTTGNAATATTATSANALNSATTTVIVNGATAPTSGQVLTATSGTAATWQTIASGASGANPTATASDTAVNGVATTFMRSDAAPAVQKGSSSVFGLVKVDGTTITSSGGVISSVGSGSAITALTGGVSATGPGSVYATANFITPQNGVYTTNLNVVGGFHETNRTTGEFTYIIGNSEMMTNPATGGYLTVTADGFNYTNPITLNALNYINGALFNWGGFYSGSGSQLTALNASVLASGTMPAGRLPAFTGDVTTSAGSSVTALANIPSATPMAGSLLATAISAPSTPASGKGSIYVDSTSKNIAVKNDAGTVNHGVQTRTATANNWIRSIADDGSTTISQPAFTDISGTAAAAQIPVATTSANGGVKVDGTTITISSGVISVSGTLSTTNVFINPIVATNTGPFYVFSIQGTGSIPNTNAAYFGFETNHESLRIQGQYDGISQHTNITAWVQGFNIPIIQAGSTNVTISGATSQTILFLHPMQNTNYVPVLVSISTTGNPVALAGYSASALTTNGFVANFTALTLTGRLGWTVTGYTQ